MFIELEKTVTQDVYWGVENNFGTTVPTNSASTNRHIGFIVEDDTLYATNANGTTQTKTDVTSGITLTDSNQYRVIWDAGTSAKFYINDTLVATHTTNLPSGTSDTPGIFIGIRNESGGANTSMTASNNYSILVTRP